MYIIEMYVEVGQWSNVFPSDMRGKRRGKPRVEWNPTGGYWSVLGGSYTSSTEAAAKIVEFSRCGSYTKPKTFRTWKRF